MNRTERDKLRGHYYRYEAGQQTKGYHEFRPHIDEVMSSIPALLDHCYKLEAALKDAYYLMDLNSIRYEEQNPPDKVAMHRDVLKRLRNLLGESE